MKAIFIILLNLTSLVGSEPVIFAEVDRPANTKWLPATDCEKSGDYLNKTEIYAFLKSLSGKFRPVLCWYTNTRLDSVRVVSQDGIHTKTGKWSCSVSFNRFTGDAMDLNVILRLSEGTCTSSGLAAIFDFTSWDISNYVLVPSMIYGGNRFKILPVGYPPYIDKKEDKPLDMPITVTNILHLNPDGSHSLIEMNTGNVSTPMLSFWSPGKKTGLIILTGQGTKFGNNGLFVEEDAGPGARIKRMSFAVTAPGVREQKYVMCGRAPSEDQPACFQTGDEITLGFRIFKFKSADLPAFYKKVFEVRKSFTGVNEYSNVTPFSAAADMILDHWSKRKWFESERFSYYCNNPSSQSHFAHQIGWSGIPVYAFPNLIGQTPDRLERFIKSMDYLVASQSGTELFYAMNRNGEKLGDHFGKESEFPSIAMMRRSLDVLHYGVKGLDLLRKRGYQDLIKPEWEISLRSCADGLIKVWNDYGQLGQFIDVETGQMDINGSTAGCAAGYAFGAAYRYFRDPRYLEVADASTEMYYKRDFLKGYTGGGAAEILQSPDSETAWDMVESCMILYDITGKQEWLERTMYAAHMLSTWMVSYDYRFPEGSAMQKAGTHAAGSIFASSQNNHSAPGYYILSGDFMLKLFRATGDKRFAEMYKDQSHNVVQYIGAPHNPLRQSSGYVTERVQISDWEGRNSIGSVNDEDTNMAWETLGALTCLENPGIYLHTDDETILVMDHVEASVTERDNEKLVLKVVNPTQYDSRIKILAETSADSKKPLQMNAFVDWPEVHIGAGMSKEVIIKHNGTIVH